MFVAFRQCSLLIDKLPSLSGEFSSLFRIHILFIVSHRTALQHFTLYTIMSPSFPHIFPSCPHHFPTIFRYFSAFHIISIPQNSAPKRRPKTGPQNGAPPVPPHPSPAARPAPPTLRGSSRGPPPWRPSPATQQPRRTAPSRAGGFDVCTTGSSPGNAIGVAYPQILIFKILKNPWKWNYQPKLAMNVSD